MPWGKGQSGNPGGRPKALKELRELAQSHAADVVKRLYEIAMTGDPAPAVAACKELLDRGFGKSPQALEVTGAEGAPLLERARELSDAELDRVWQESRGETAH